MVLEIIQLSEKQNELKGRAIALGSFDGVHQGHQKVFQKVIAQKNLISCAMTFKEPPIKCLQPDIRLELITTLEERLELFRVFGIKQAIVFDFKQIQKLSAVDYLKLLVDDLNCQFLTCGPNHCFGRNKEGNTQMISEFAQRKGLNFEVINYLLTEDKQIISSSLIRHKIKESPIEEANKLLNHNFLIIGNLTIGAQIGSQLGFPTLNFNYPKDKVKPLFGVYAALTTIQKQKYLSAVNFGLGPTIKQLKDPILESHLLEIPKTEYLPKSADKLQIELIKFVRPEQKFNSFNELKAQIKKDCELIKGLLNKYS